MTIIFVSICFVVYLQKNSRWNSLCLPALWCWWLQFLSMPNVSWLQFHSRYVRCQHLNTLFDKYDLTQLLTQKICFLIGTTDLIHLVERYRQIRHWIIKIALFCYVWRRVHTGKNVCTMFFFTYRSKQMQWNDQLIQSCARFYIFTGRLELFLQSFFFSLYI